jgi:hypothetical protein
MASFGYSPVSISGITKMNYKKQRLGTKLLRAARTEQRYRDIHVFIGGTGAIGGTALLQMLSMYEEMMSVQVPKADDVPILVTTGRAPEELHAFTRRLFRFIESREGLSKHPKRVASGYLTRSGIFIALERFQLSALPGLEEMRNIPESEQPQFAREFLSKLSGESYPVDNLIQAIAAHRPISTFLKSYQSKHFKEMEPVPFRSVIIGIPIPSLMAYHLDHLEDVARYVGGLTAEKIEELHVTFRRAFREDLNEIKTSLANEVLVAHTTAVGGMYDEDIKDGKLHRTIRLGFAHSAQDNKLVIKQREAEEFAREYAAIGIKVLVTAAAVGIDELRIRAEIPLHFQIAQKLQETREELFPVAKKMPRSSVNVGKEAKRPAPARHVIRIYKPLTLPLNSPQKSPARFARGEPLRPAYSIRSGENGFFTVSNADALYRVMRIASASELGLVLATVGIFGDDPITPWFDNNVCYYTETDNSRQVFDLLNQPPLLRAQMTGLEPLALQDLGSSKHQGELHTLSLLILLHRVRTLDTDAIDPYIDIKHFDPSHFFVEHSRPLMFEDIETWHVDTLCREMQILASAETMQDLLELIPNRYHSGLFPLRDKALHYILERVLKAVWMIPSVGSPLIFDRLGTTFIRTGFFAAPLDLLITEQDSIVNWLVENYTRHIAAGYEDREHPCSFAEFRDFHICAGGFVDVRPTATLCVASHSDSALTGKVKQFFNEEDLRTELLKIEPYSSFTTSGLIALKYRLRALHKRLQEAMAELGTLHEFRWQMPRDANGHILLVPGVVEAFRMFSEGLEKTTGTERLDGIWGYERRIAPERWKDIPGIDLDGY